MPRRCAARGLEIAIAVEKRLLGLGPGTLWWRRWDSNPRPPACKAALRSSAPFCSVFDRTGPYWEMSRRFGRSAGVQWCLAVPSRPCRCPRVARSPRSTRILQMATFAATSAHQRTEPDRPSRDDSSLDESLATRRTACLNSRVRRLGDVSDDHPERDAGNDRPGDGPARRLRTRPSGAGHSVLAQRLGKVGNSFLGARLVTEGLTPELD